ncbi:hypothetical protein HU200_062511 [Digitaria exilis]|uniref:F-box domain-containing protein n=1 Tax=Digitaria exilis TaxID=1010633 RepID=A0A835A7D0_9POAL|nr:hypothetical protein HU200_062511 [Digitaria exilis]
MDVDTWASPPPELLLEIFSRLPASATLSCSGVCKPWRRTILNNATSFLRPRPDRFFPGLLLGFLHNRRDAGRRHVSLQRLLMPGPPEFAPAVTAAGLPAVISSFLVHGGAELAPYDEVLSSRDGLVLLRGKNARDRRLCLRNLMTGQCKLLPSGEFKDACTYVLLTGYDLAGVGDTEALVVLAVKEKDIDGGMTYQIFSAARGGGGASWGEVTSSPRFTKGGHVTLTRIYPGSEVIVFGGAVHWLAMAAELGGVECAVALDVRTGRTWSTRLPEGCGRLDYYGSLSTRPARLVTSADGRLSLVRSFGDCLVEVWVLAGGDQWAPRRTIDVRSLLPYRRWRDEAVLFSAFCPRSGWLVGHLDGMELLVDAERGSCCMVDTNHGECLFSYEMDWSTYLAKMKHF